MWNRLKCRVLSVALTILPTCVLATASAADVPEHEVVQSRPKIGLVLGGGGAKGAAHVGVLRVLEDLHIPIDYIAGSSMGSIVAGLYAAGLSPADIQMRMQQIDWDDVMQDKPARQDLSFWRKQDDSDYLVKLELGIRDGEIRIPKGLTIGQKFNLLLKWFTLHVSYITDFDRLPVPFRPVAVDIANGDMVAIDHGNLSDAIRASAALPGFFAPVEVNGRLLIDGAMANNLPVDVVRDMGADVVIVVDVGAKFAPTEELKSALDISSQAMLMMSRRNADRQISSLEAGDIFLAPPLNHIETLEFSRSKEAIEIGEKFAREHSDRLAAYSVDDSKWQHFLARHRVPQDRAIKIKNVTVKNDSPVSTAAIKHRIALQPGQKLSLAALNEDISRIYGMGDFEYVNFSLLQDGDDVNLQYETRGKDWGPNYLRFGITIVDNFDGDSRYQFIVNYNKTQINRYGAEWKSGVRIGHEQAVFTSFLQPIGYAGDYFTNGTLQFRRFFPAVHAGADLVQYEVLGSQANILFGRQIGPNLGAIVLGPKMEWLRGNPRVRSTGLEDIDVQVGGVISAFLYDQLDNTAFPKTGSELLFSYETNGDFLDSDYTYRKSSLAAARFITHERHTLMTGLRLGSSFNTDIPFFDRFSLGGFASLSGYQEGELDGNHLGFANLVYMYRLPGAHGIPEGLHLGGSLETGRVWEKRRDINSDDLIFAGSAFLGMDTFFGPVYFAYGHAQSGINSLYLFFGRTF